MRLLLRRGVRHPRTVLVFRIAPLTRPPHTPLRPNGQLGSTATPCRPPRAESWRIPPHRRGGRVPAVGDAHSRQVLRHGGLAAEGPPARDARAVRARAPPELCRLRAHRPRGRALPPWGRLVPLGDRAVGEGRVGGARVCCGGKIAVRRDGADAEARGEGGCGAQGGVREGVGGVGGEDAVQAGAVRVLRGEGL